MTGWNVDKVWNKLSCTIICPRSLLSETFEALNDILGLSPCQYPLRLEILIFSSMLFSM